jgi:hypothetical protein
MQHNANHEPANDPGLLFHITLTGPGTLVTGYCRYFLDSCEARMDGEERAAREQPGAKVSLRPDIETSFTHGKLRWPKRLHANASPEARRGHAQAERDAMYARSGSLALAHASV